MSQTPKRSVYSLLAAEDVRRIVNELKLVGALIALGLLLVVVLAVAAVVVRCVYPVAGSISAVVGAGIFAVVALGGGMTVLELSNRRAKTAEALDRSVAAYRLGCAVAGGANFLAGGVCVIVIFVNGVSRGLWLPELVLVALSVVGLVLAVPRVTHLRELYYSPTLPVTRV